MVIEKRLGDGMENRANSDHIQGNKIIIHISTVHLRDDSRILSKQVRSIAADGKYRVEFFVQDGKGDQIDSASGIWIRDTGNRQSRIKRMILGGWQMFRAVVKARPVVVHFHDPELLPWCVLMRLFGILIVYDIHEDYPEAVSHNYRLPSFVRSFISPIVRFVEWASTPFLTGIVAVTPQIGARFPGPKTVLVRNFPISREFHGPGERPMHSRPKEVAYIGTITENRNIIGMLNAINSVRDSGVILRLAGGFTVGADEEKARAHPGWGRVRFDGWISREGIADVLESARAGLVTIKPIPHEMITLPIKLFEYMAAGVPVISSNFPLWRTIVEKARCGLLVDPEKPGEIAEAILWMVEHPEEAEGMGRRGREAVMADYNWELEVHTLLRLYDRIVGNKADR
jgi:glycosyltransferase involved in cell wall biosynthesis